MTISDLKGTTVAVPLAAPLRHATGVHCARFIRIGVGVARDDGLSGRGGLCGGGGGAEAAALSLLPCLKRHDPLNPEQVR